MDNQRLSGIIAIFCLSLACPRFPYKFPQDRKGEGMTKNFSEVKENGNRTDKRRS